MHLSLFMGSFLSVLFDLFLLFSLVLLLFSYVDPFYAGRPLPHMHEKRETEKISTVFRIRPHCGSHAELIE